MPEILMEEIASLKKAGYQIQHNIVGDRIYIVFKDYKLPHGNFNKDCTDLLVWTSTNYPEIAFDMFWTDESLLLANKNIPKNAGVIQSILNKNWRRFSIHPYQHTPWVPYQDSLETYLTYINQRLKNKI